MIMSFKVLKYMLVCRWNLPYLDLNGIYKLSESGRSQKSHIFVQIFTILLREKYMSKINTNEEKPKLTK